MNMIFDGLLVLIYRPTVWLAFQILCLLKPFLGAESKLSRAITARQKLPFPPPRTSQQVRRVLVHCASGEFEYARPMVRTLKASDPSIEVFVSYFSETYKGVIAKDPNVTWSGPLPFHSPAQIKAWLIRLQPDQILIARTDVWPDLVRIAMAHKIPTVLFSASFPRAWEGTSLVKNWLTRFRLRHLSQIHVVQQQDVDFLNRLHIPAQASGDTRYDQVFHRLDNPKAIPSELIQCLPDDPEKILVIGSSWHEDEEALAPFLRSAIAENGFSVVIAPHEPTPAHLLALEMRLQSQSVESVRLSSLAQGSSKAPVILVDRVGILAELYTVGRWAFVGGSFRKTVHSVMEPLAAGCKTLVGPLYRNNAEAIEFQKLGAVRSVSSSDEALRALSQSWPTKSDIQAQVRSRAGATEKILGSR